jgi:phosphoglycolate phosphatase
VHWPIWGTGPVSRAFIARTVGKGSEYLILRSLAEAGAPASLYEQAWARYQHHYLAINGQHSAVFEGVIPGLQALRAAGLRLACLTNKPNAFARPLLALKGLDGFSNMPSGATLSRARSPTRCRCWKPARPWARRLRAR